MKALKPTYTLAKYLVTTKHTPYIYSPILGKVAKKIQDLGVKISHDLRTFKTIPIDIIHAHHNITAIQARAIFPKTPMILVVHGILPALEKCPFISLGIYKYVAVSE